MLADAALTHLNTHRAAILAILGSAEAMLTDSQKRDIAGLAMARWSLMRELTAYQLFKNAKLLDPAIARGARDGERARRLKQEGTDAVDAFRGNVQRWSATDVAAVWPTYQASALAMIARLRAQVTREGQEIAALVTPPPAAVPPRPGPPIRVG